MISKYISLPVFLISFTIGLFFIYILGPDRKSILVYPSPQTYLNVLYRDNADQCFQFEPVPIKCPDNTNDIHTVPIQ